MRIKMRTIYAGPHGAYGAGEIADLPKSHAYDLIEHGFAIQEGADEAEADGPAETADLTVPETGENAAGKRRRQK